LWISDHRSPEAGEHPKEAFMGRMLNAFATFKFRERRTRRLWLAAMALAAVTVVAIVLVPGSSANLAGSTFEGNDGNLVVNTPGNHDWDNAPNLSVGVDLTTGTSDNSFGQGAKENDVNTTVVSGSIPNSKADLARFAVAGEVIGTDSYIYLAWSRENQSGTVNFDFELNAAAQPNLTTPGSKTLVRTNNDLLINYSFQGGSNTPTLTRYIWNGSSWGTGQAIASACSEGATNSSPVDDTLGGNPSVTRPAQQFGEAAINLTCANIVPPNTCEPFSSAYVKSRSSTSFNSEIKDFIAPISIGFSNCGSLTIIKHTDPRGLDQSFSYTTTGAGLSGFSLNDTGNSGGGDSAGNTKTFTGLQAGTKTVTEGADPAGFSFTSLTCVDSNGNSSTTNGKVASVTIAGGGSTTCTYVNTQLKGAILVTKTAKHAASGSNVPVAQAGVDFTVNGVTKATDANGQACFDGLTFGAGGTAYDVTETVPTGYAADGLTTKSVTVDNNATCSDNPYGGETVAFSNTPKTDVTITVNSQVDGGTASTIDCDNDGLDGASDANGDVTKSVTDQLPQTIHCTIVIDP